MIFTYLPNERLDILEHLGELRSSNLMRIRAGSELSAEEIFFNCIEQRARELIIFTNDFPKITPKHAIDHANKIEKATSGLLNLIDNDQSSRINFRSAIKTEFIKRINGTADGEKFFETLEWLSRYAAEVQYLTKTKDWKSGHDGRHEPNRDDFIDNCILEWEHETGNLATATLNNELSNFIMKILKPISDWTIKQEDCVRISPFQSEEATRKYIGRFITDRKTQNT